jgi:hypothetical protein
VDFDLTNQLLISFMHYQILEEKENTVSQYISHL